MSEMLSYKITSRAGGLSL